MDDLTACGRAATIADKLVIIGEFWKLAGVLSVLDEFKSSYDVLVNEATKLEASLPKLVHCSDCAYSVEDDVSLSCKWKPAPDSSPPWIEEDAPKNLGKVNSIEKIRCVVFRSK